MSNASTFKSSGESAYGELIYSYSRAQAIADGVLIDAGAMAEEAGFLWPVALTSAAWEDCVAWSEQDNERQTYQDESGRLWDLLFMARHAIRLSQGDSDRMLFKFYRVPRDGKASKAVLVTLKLIVGPGDQGAPVITVLQPNED